MTTELIDGGDGYLYKPLTMQEALDLCMDVQLYIEYKYGNTHYMEKRVLSPRDYLDDPRYWKNDLEEWYSNIIFPQYIRLDTDKPEYEPV